MWRMCAGVYVAYACMRAYVVYVSMCTHARKHSPGSVHQALAKGLRSSSRSTTRPCRSPSHKYKPMYACVYACVCACAYAGVYACVSACTSQRVCKHVRVDAVGCRPINIRMSKDFIMYVCVWGGGWVRVCECVCVCMDACIYAFINSHTHTHTHTHTQNTHPRVCVCACVSAYKCSQVRIHERPREHQPWRHWALGPVPSSVST